MSGFAELGARSNFSFLDGASHPEELVETAQALGLAGLGICDTNSLAGVVRGDVAANLRQGLVVVVRSIRRDISFLALDHDQSAKDHAGDGHNVRPCVRAWGNPNRDREDCRSDGKEGDPEPHVVFDVCARVGG
jgi:hypothetical protein